MDGGEKSGSALDCDSLHAGFARTEPSCLGSQPQLGARAAAPTRAIQTGRAGLEAQGEGKAGTRTAGAWTPRTLTARAAPAPGPPRCPTPLFCSAALTRIYRQQRRHLAGALRSPPAARRTRERARPPAATPEQKASTRPRPNRALGRPGPSEHSKLCSGSQSSVSTRTIPIQIRQEQPVRRREVRGLTLICSASWDL